MVSSFLTRKGRDKGSLPFNSTTRGPSRTSTALIIFKFPLGWKRPSGPWRHFHVSQKNTEARGDAALEGSCWMLLQVKLSGWEGDDTPNNSNYY